MSDMGPDFIEVGLKLTYSDDPAEFQAAADKLSARWREQGAKSGDAFADGMTNSARESVKRVSDAWTKGMQEGMKLILNAQKAGLDRLKRQQEAANYEEQQTLERKFERQRIAQKGGWSQRLADQKAALQKEVIAERAGANEQYEATRQGNRLQMEAVKNANATKLQEARLANSRWVVNTQAFEAKQLADLKAHNARVTELYKQSLKAIQTTYTEALRVMRSTWESGLRVINDTVRGFFARRRSEQAEDDDSSVSRLRERFNRENAVTRAGMAEQSALMARGRSVGASVGAVGASGLAGDATQAEGAWERLRNKVSGVQVAVAVVAASGVMFVKSTLDTTAQIGADVLKISRYTGESAKGASDLRFAFQQSGIDIDKAAKALGIFSKNLVAGKVDGIADGGASLKAQAAATKQQAAAQDAVNKAQQRYNDLLTVQAGKKQLTAADLIARRNATDAITTAQAKLNAITIPAADMATKYGITVRDTTGKLLPMSQILLNVADKFKAMPNGIEKTNLALQLFGRGGADMEKFLNRGSVGLQNLYNEAHKFGLELTGANADAIQKHINASRRWTAAWQGVQFQIGLHVLPLLTAVTTFLTRNMMPAFATLSWWFNSTFGPVLRVVTALWDKVVDVAERLWTKLTKYPAVVNGVLTFLKGTAIALGLIVAGAGAVKVIELLGLAFKVLGAFAADNPGIIAIGLLSAGLYTLFQMNPQIGKFFGALVDGFKGWFEVGRILGKPIEGLSNLVLLQSTIGALVGTLVDNIGFLKGAVILLFRGDFARADTYLAEWWNRVAAVLAPMGSKIKAWVLDAVDAATGFVGDLFTALLGGDVGAGGNKMAATIGATIRQYVMAAIDWVWSNAQDLYSGWTNGLIGVVARAGGNDSTVAAKIGDKLHDWISTGIATAWSGITSFWSGLFGGAGDNAAASGIGQQIGDALGSALSAIGDTAGKIGSALLAALSSGWKWVSDHVDFTQILPMVEKAVQWLGYQIGRIVGSKQFIEVLGGIALAMGGLAADIAGHFVLGLIQGLINRRGDIGKVVSTILDAAFSNPISGIATSLALVFTGFKVVGGIMYLITLAKELWVNLQLASIALRTNEAFNGAEGLGAGLAAMTNKVKFLRDGFSKVQEKISSLPAGVRIAGAALAIVGAYMGGEMIAHADNAAAAIRGVATAATSIAVAFATGGPIAGGIAIVTTLVGYLLNRTDEGAEKMKKNAESRLADLKTNAKAVSEDLLSYSQSFYDAFKQDNNNPLLGIQSALMQKVDSDPAFRKLINEMGIDITTLADKANAGGKVWKNYVASIKSSEVNKVFGDAAYGLKNYATQIKDANTAFFASASKGQGDGFRLQLSTVLDLMGTGKISVNQMADALHAQGMKWEEARALAAKYKDGLTNTIDSSARVKSVTDDVSSSIRTAASDAGKYIDKQVELKQKQDAAAEAAKPLSERIADGWDKISGAIQKAKDNLDKFHQAQSGKGLTEAQSNIAVDDAAKQIKDLYSQTQATLNPDGTVTPATLNLRQFNDQLTVLKSQLSGDLSERVVGIFRDSHGDRGKALTDLKALRDQMVEELLPAFGNDRQAAEDFVNQVTSVPPDAYKDLGISTQKQQTTQDLLNSSLFSTLFTLGKLSDTRPSVDVSGFKPLNDQLIFMNAALDSALFKLTNMGDAAINAGIKVAQALDYAQSAPGSAVGAGLGIAARLPFALGGFTPSGGPTPALVHPNEVVLPLGDKMRMKELLSQRGLGEMVAGVMPPSAWNGNSDIGSRSFDAPQPGGSLSSVPSMSEVNHWNITTTADAHMTAVEVQRERRKAKWLTGGRR